MALLRWAGAIVFSAAALGLSALPSQASDRAAAPDSTETARPVDSGTAKNVNAAQHIDFETVVPSNSPMATALVVRGKAERLYLFPPGTEVTRTKTHLVVRGYGSVFVYRLDSIKARRPRVS